VPILQIVSPVDGSIFAERETASAAKIEQILADAKTAGKLWRSVSVSERVRLIEAMVKNLEGEITRVSEELTRQMGRPISHTPNEIRRGFQERARHMCSIAESCLADIAVPQTSGFKKFIRREPVGAVLVVAPWNYPYLTAMNSIVPALLAGNTIILKPASQTMLVAERIQDAFDAAGFPRNVFQHLQATHQDIEKMIADQRINGVVFTGSVEGGAAIERAAAGRFVSVGTELGGKDPAYVRADADVAFAVNECVDGSFFNAGQSCCAIERIYVHDAVYDEFVEGFAQTTRSYVLGDPLDEKTNIGPMVSTKAAEFVRRQVEQARSLGAKALVEEKFFAASQVGSPYLGPTVLVNVDHSMSVMSDESFGPVIGIMRVSSDEQAIDLMNDSRYGLTASIWTHDEIAAVKIGEKIETGTVFMNRCDYVDPVLAWTGVKDTGNGIALSSLGFDAYVRAKSFHLRQP
jgi:acyl-CoA reductase-like NAD-dependent aldehyde dehydrogenase